MPLVQPRPWMDILELPSLAAAWPSLSENSHCQKGQLTGNGKGLPQSAKRLELPELFHSSMMKPVFRIKAMSLQRLP